MASVLSLPRPLRHLDPLAAPAGRRDPSAALPALAAVLLGLGSGVAIALGGLTSLYLCLSVVSAGIIVYDFRVGVVLLILLMPISHSVIFPHEMLGITGLNPVNLLLVATLGSYLLKGIFDGSIWRLLPRPLLWLYIVPILFAGALGALRVDEIVSAFYAYELIAFNDVFGYLRDMVAKPLLMVIFALLVAAAAAHSDRPERLLIPVVMSVWLMSALVLGFVLLAGASFDQLAQASAREFLSPLGLHANELGRLYTIAYALMLFAWGQSREQVTRMVLLGSMIVVTGALLLTFSRAAFGAFLAVNVLYLLWHRNARALLFLILLMAVGLMVLPGAVYERVMMGFGQGFDAIVAGRLEGLWVPLFPEIFQSPLYGSGIASILWADAMKSGMGTTVLAVTHPHNAYLETLLDMGMIGLILFGLYFLHVWRGFMRLHDDPTVSPVLRGLFLGGAAGLLSLLFAAFAGSSLMPRPEQSFLWLAIGLMYGLTAKTKSAV